MQGRTRSLRQGLANDDIKANFALRVPVSNSIAGEGATGKSHLRGQLASPRLLSVPKDSNAAIASLTDN